MKQVKFEDICCPNCKSKSFREDYQISTLMFSPSKIINGNIVIKDVNSYTYNMICNKCNKPFQFIKSQNTYFIKDNDLFNITVSSYDTYSISKSYTLFIINREKQPLDKKYNVDDEIKINNKYWIINQIEKFNYGEYGESPIIAFVCSLKT